MIVPRFLSSRKFRGAATFDFCNTIGIKQTFQIDRVEAVHDPNATSLEQTHKWFSSCLRIEMALNLHLICKMRFVSPCCDEAAMFRGRRSVSEVPSVVLRKWGNRFHLSGRACSLSVLHIVVWPRQIKGARHADYHPRWFPCCDRRFLD